MSANYSQLGSLDHQAISGNIRQERQTELQVLDRHGHSHAHGESCSHDHQGSSHGHSHGHSHGNAAPSSQSHGHTHANGQKCNSDHGHSQPERVSSGRPAQLSSGKEEDDKCGHSHGPGEGCSGKSSKTSDYFIRFFTMGMPFNCIMLQQFWLNDTLKDSPFEYYASTIFMWSILILCAATYYQAVTTKNNVVKRLPPPADPSIYDEQMRNTQMCKDCHFWKPMRTKHCRTCGGCNIRMDHHCPWLTNCVGLRNNRAFYLFTVYMMSGALQYCYRTLMYFNYLNEAENFWENSGFFYAYWIFTTLVLVPISLMLFGLTSFHSMLLINNATTLDAMGGLSLGLSLTPQQKVKPNQRSINLFNRGLVANVRDFFSADLFFWWWPFTTFTPNDGMLYPVAPPTTFSDVQYFINKEENRADEPEKTVEQYLQQFEQRVQEEKGRLTECNLKVNEQIFPMWTPETTIAKAQDATNNSESTKQPPAVQLEEISLL